MMHKLQVSVLGVLLFLGAAAFAGAQTADRYEPDSMMAPLALTPGGAWISRTIHQGDVDWFSLRLNAAQLLVLETSGDLDTQLELYDGTSGTVLAEDDDGGEDYNARIEYEVEAGKSYLAKLGAYEEETGSYQIRATLEAIPQDAYEPNNTQQQAANLTPGRTVSAIIQSQSDLDWFKLTAPAGNPLLVAYTEGNLDTTVTVYNAQGAELADDDDSGDGENARVAVSVPQGTVYIRVSGYGSSYGNYSLTAQFVEVKPDLYENDDTAPRAKEITVGTPQERSFTTASDVDWAKFIIRQAGAYAIRAVGADESLDTYLELYSFEQDALDEDDDGGDNLDALIRTRLDPGTYLIKVSTLNDGPLEDNRYTLSVRRE